MGKPEKIESFWAIELSQLYGQLHSSASGLSENAAQNILESAGKQKTESYFKKDLKIFFSQYKSPVLLLLIGAVILSVFLGDTSDAVIIALILLASGVVSFFQERNAGRVVEKLESMITIRSQVLRDGIEKDIPAAQVVPGDVIVFNAGDMVPADCLIIEANELNVNESSLTGESFPVRKKVGLAEEKTVLSKRTNCLWEGTNIITGNAKALAINTGSNTVFGTVVKSAETVTETSFEKGLKEFGFMLMRITLVLSVLILIVNLLNHKAVIDSVLFALALAVGIAPELLPAITTMAMSAGAKKLLNKKVIVKKLNSIQNFGEVNLLCTDKTGTITEGAIKIENIVNAWGETDENVKTLAYWNAFFETGYLNPIDEAIRTLKPKNVTNPRKLTEIPFDFIRKRLSIAVDTGTEKLLISKGAFEQCLSICTTVKMPDGKIEKLDVYKDKILENYERFGMEGMRVIGVCYKKTGTEVISKQDETEMTFAGFILMDDPVKSGVTEAIGKLKELNIDLKIISGDNKIISQSIGKQIGIENPVIITGKELLHISPEALCLKVKHAHIFCEVEPQQKESVIQALRKSYTVAYLGDGINDVPAINAADIGISVDNAVDVAREAADIILLQKHLSVIVDGIKEGRKTFANTLKYIYISTGSTFGNMCSVSLASLFLPFLPMLPKQILLTNFFTDFPFLAIPADNVDKVQLEKPGRWNMKLIRNYMIIFGIHSSLFDLITFITLLYILRLQESAFQTAWFIESGLTELLIFFIIRTGARFFKSRPAKLITLLSFACSLLTIALPYFPFSDKFGLVPLPAYQLGLMLLIVLGYVITADILKIWFFRKFNTK